MLKVEFFKKLGLAVFGVSGVIRNSSRADAAGHDAESLVGLWEMIVTSKDGTYHYIYAISSGAWVCTGNIDEGFQQQKYSPSMGAYVRNADGSYRYEERGWVYDPKGNNVGAFRSVGTITLAADQKTFSGPGVFTQFDMKGKPVYKELFSATATRVSV